MSREGSIEKGSLSTAAGKEDFDTPEDRKLLRKVDFRLLPILTFLYLLSFLDRSNIGNAKIIGLVEDLKISPPEYNTALALYFVAYVIFEVPANVRAGSRVPLPNHISTKLWNLSRLLLGITEAGLFPGVIYVFSVYYRRHERSWRVAIFFGGAALAGAFGGTPPRLTIMIQQLKNSACPGILAYAIGKMEGIGGKRGWAWIFIIEGLLTVVSAVFAYFVVPTWSHNAKFLTTSEKERLLARLDADSDAALIEKFEWTYVKQAMKDHLVWGYALLFHGFAFVLYSLSLFMPTIIADLGFASWQAQLMTVPPNSLASISIWATVWVSARVNKRAPSSSDLLSLQSSSESWFSSSSWNIRFNLAGAQYVGVHFAAAGVYTGNALLLSWPGENVSAQTKRAIAVAMQITIGDIGAIAGQVSPGWLILAGNNFRTPHIISIGYLLFSILVTVYLAIWMSKENRRRDRLLKEMKDGDLRPSTPEERLRLGDRHITYRYVY
ncbi:high-affinity nicotinic acid transporter [Coprinopsis cinerea AmutBmut pab1-1]|nr:high-affinity nicotinic acid transporter [Coprinopsis cinerea AmutBmut pab1-1]